MIINFNKNRFNLRYISKITEAYEYALKALKVPCKDIEINIDFVSRARIKELNKNFRDKDAVTDVLSFPNLLNIGETNMHLITDKITKSNYKAEINPENGCIFLGDICICKSVVFKQAKEYGNSRDRELTYMAVHGLLHLMGYDHIIEEEKSIMREVEEKIMKHVNLERK